MTEKQAFSFRKEPRGDLYRVVLELASQRCSTGLLVVRDPRTLGAPGREALESLRPFLMEARETTEWPGTILRGDKALVYRYQMSSALVKVLESLADSLYSWSHPDLPEDLCFLRSDGTPWLVSIAHEGDAYLEMTHEEMRKLLDLEPKLTDYISED